LWFASCSRDGSFGVANSTLFQFGPVKFEVSPLNIHAYEHVTGTEYARKMVMNSIPQREWVGEADHEIILNGMVFEKRIPGGFAMLEFLDSTRLAGVAHTLIRGDSTSGGDMLGWFVCEHLERRHSFLGGDGRGRVIAWQGFFSRCDQPAASDYFFNLNQISGP
jgi:phage protein U